MGDVFLGGVAIVTLAAFIAQVIAFGAPPYDARTLVRKLAVVAISAFLVFLAVIGLVAFTYCEANCQSRLDWRTAGIALIVLLVDAGTLWLSWQDLRPVFGSSTNPSPPQ